MRVLTPDAPENMVSETIRTMISCTTCSRRFSFEEGEDLAVDRGIKEEVVLCPGCGSVFEVNITPEAMTIAADVTSRYGLEPQLAKAVPDETATHRQPNTLKMVIVEFLALGFAVGATQMGGGIPAMIIGCVAILLALFGLYVWRRL